MRYVIEKLSSYNYKIQAVKEKYHTKQHNNRQRDRDNRREQQEQQGNTKDETLNGRCERYKKQKYFRPNKYQKTMFGGYWILRAI